MKTFKAIAYAYPSSPNAYLLGSPGYYVMRWDISPGGNPGMPYLAPGRFVCKNVHDSRLRLALLSTEGEYVAKECMYSHLTGRDPIHGKWKSIPDDLSISTP